MTVTTQHESASHPLCDFISRSTPLLDLYHSDRVIRDDELDAFIKCEELIRFLMDLNERAEMLEYSRESLLQLSDQIRQFDRQRDELPPDEPGGYIKTLPDTLVTGEAHTLVAFQAHASLVCYEMTSMATMLAQLRITLADASEAVFLIKVRDRFLSHPRLGGVRRGWNYGYSIGDRGMLALDLTALNSWSDEQMRYLRARGFPKVQREEQMRRNEELILSKTHNEKLSADELLALRAGGLRECNIEVAIAQFGEVLLSRLLPAITETSERAVREFGFERPPGGPTQSVRM